MKLRLETGNFKITGTADVEAQTIAINDLPKGLSPEDFLGCVVDLGSTVGLAVVTHVYKPEENVVAFAAGNFAMAYNRLTGEVTAAE